MNEPACPKSILVVEDDHEIRRSLKQILESEGYEVVARANGQEALDYLAGCAQLPCLILLDLMMPVVNGWEFREMQKQDERLRDVPVVAISATAQIISRFDAADFLYKPIQLDVLLMLVQRYC